MQSITRFEQTRNWSDEEALVIEQVRKITAEIIAPNAAGHDERKEFPWPAFEAFRQIGLNGIFIPEEYGGTPVSYRCFLEIVRIISEGCAASGITFGTTGATVKPFLEFGTEAQRRKLLPRVAEGAIGALALTEAHAGSDAGDMRTKFRPEGDEIVINGGKIFITSASVADYVLLFGKWSKLDDSAKAISAVIVEKGTPGFDIVRIENKMGTNASPTCEIAFADCRVPRENLIGNPGDGMKIMLAVLNKSRPSVAAQSLGVASAALNDMLAHANERKQGGKRIIRHQAISHMIADHATELLAARLLLDHVGHLVDAGTRDMSVEASMLKVKASDLAMRLTTDAVQVFGGHGYTKEHRVERLMREAKIGQIWESTNQIQRNVISRDLIAR